MRTIPNRIRILPGKFYIMIGIITFLIALGTFMSRSVLLLLGGLVGFFILTFAPGFLILRILGVNPLRGGRYILYSIGLSMAFLALLALFLSLFYPLIGISNPMTASNILLGFALWFILLLLLFFLAQKDSRNVIEGTLFQVDNALLLFALPPLISVVGAHLVNFYAENAAMIVLLFALSLVPFLSRVKRASTHLYPAAVLSTSLSLQFHRNLVTNYVIGSDIQTTFYSANLVKSLQAWFPYLGGDSPLIMVSAVPALYSSLLGISLDWTFKILNSFLYALTPVCVFYVFKDAFGEKAGFHASLFFAFQHGFIVYGTPCKQQIAELFMALLLLAAFDESLKGTRRALLMVLFSFLMVNSHYGTSFIFFLCMVAAYLILRFLGREERARALSLNHISFFFVLMFSWYMYTSEGEIFNRIVRVWEMVLREAWTVLTAQKVIHRSGAALLSETLSRYVVLYQINLIIYAVLTALTVVGVVRTAWAALKKHRKMSELDALTLPLTLFLFASFFIVGGFGIDRMYVLSSVVLSGYLLSGYEALVKILGRILSARTFSRWKLDAILSSLLSLFLLFNTGLIYHLAGTPIESAVSLNPNSNTLAYSDAEISGVRWLVNNTAESGRIFTDYYSGNMLKRFYELRVLERKVFPLKLIVKLSDLPNVLRENDLLYIRSRALSSEAQDEPQYLRISELEQVESLLGKIYDNGASKIYG